MKAKLTGKKSAFAAVIPAVRKLGSGVALAALVLFAVGTIIHAQKRAKTTKPEPSADPVVEALKEMNKELREIKALLAARPPAPTPAAAPTGPQQAVTIDLANRPFRGAKDAPITIIEFTDYECPFCSRHVQQTLPQLEKEYIATGKVKYYVVDLPLESIHRNAFKAAVAVRCAGEQGKYWEMHDRLFANQRTLADWNAHAAAINLDAAKFNDCLSSDKYAADVRKDIALTQTVGVQGTPGFYFAAGSGTKVRTSSFINGARPFPAMKEQIDALLQQQKQTAKTGAQ